MKQRLDGPGPAVPRIGLLLLLLYPAAVGAFGSGISMKLANLHSDWDFSSGTREAQLSQISFQFEDRTDAGLTVGGELGYFDMRVVAASDSSAETMKFGGQYIGVYLRQPLRVNDWLSFHGKLGLRYASGHQSGADGSDEAEVDWTGSLLELGMSLRFSNFRLTPYASYHDVDGDISDGGVDVFEMDEAESRGIRIDYFVEDTAFVQIEFTTGGTEGGYLNFVRRY